MENVRKSRKVALDLIEDTRDVIEGVTVDNPVTNVRLRNVGSECEDQCVGPSTSKQDRNKRPSEYVKYGKITFNTTAILHHYPQMQNSNSNENTASRAQVVATKKSDLNLPLPLADNNNGLKPANKETKITVTEVKDKEDDRDSDNNNSAVRSTSANVNTLEVLKKPVKFTEEKLV